MALGDRVEAFTHLHVASSYSLRYGTATPRALAARAADLGMPALALTDRDGLYGAFKHVKACADAGIMPLLGVDLALRPTGGALLSAGDASLSPGGRVAVYWPSSHSKTGGSIESAGAIVIGCGADSVPSASRSLTV